ncbi:MAG: quinone oxidoreductase [Burkholderiales bacterium]|nr:quinone oxidoreductase [Burkholderiales bacterium]
MQVLAIELHAPGAADQLKPVTRTLTPPAPHEVRVRHHASGVNFVDIYLREGLYPLPGFPAVLGVEGAGVVEAVGSAVQNITVGDRVAYAAPPAGGYIEARNLDARWVAKLPDNVSFDAAAGAMLRGVTAHMLFNRVRAVGHGDTVLVHAAAGGLGVILTQWAKSLGATVIGTVGSAEKAALAMAHGLDHAILYRETDFVAETMRLTDGRGADFVVDGIGGDTLPRSFAAAALFGTVASIGQPAGPIAPVNPQDLSARCAALSRPSVFRYVTDAARYRAGVEETIQRLANGMQAHVGGRVPLADAAKAHGMLERGETTGSLILVP